jgi:hypothetical protein
MPTSRKAKSCQAKQVEARQTAEQCQHFEFAGDGYGIHWPDIHSHDIHSHDVDEDQSTEGLLRGAPAPGW